MVRKSSLVAAAAALVLVSAASAASAGTIVLANDEWTLSNAGFSATPANTAAYVDNLATFFSGGGPATIYAYSANFGFTESTLASTMSGAGHAYTVGTAITWDLPTLLGYDAIWLGGTAIPDFSVLTAYVNAGGNVYLAGGTATLPGGAAGEAAYWNTFLSAFGLSFGSPYNGVTGVMPIASAHPIFSGVTGLYQQNGSDTLDIAPLDPSNVVLVMSPTGGHALYAIATIDVGINPTSIVPVPAAAWMGLSLLGGIAAVGGLRRRRALAQSI